MVSEVEKQPYVKVLTSKEIDAWSDDEEVNTELSDEARAILSEDIVADGIIVLIKLLLENGMELRVSSNPSYLHSFDRESKAPIYGTMYKNEFYAYMPFNYIMESASPNGEIDKTGIEIVNYDFELARAAIEQGSAIKMKISVITKVDQEVLHKNNLMYLTDVTVTEDTISGTLQGYSILAEQFPRGRYYASVFPGLYN